MELPEHFLLYVLAGFVAQLIDGALGMAYGVSASSLLSIFGVSPQVVSATVHAAECFTTGASGLSHHAFGNVDRTLFRRLLIPAVIGAVVGAYILTSIDGKVLKPYISVYLVVMGLVIIGKAFTRIPPRKVTTHLAPLGFFGALVDAMCGGGWGPIVASNLIIRGNDTRITVGSVNAVEFFVTLAASITFFLTIGLTHWNIILALAIGGVIAAPLAAWAAKHIPHKPFMVLVGVLIVVINSLRIFKIL
ncbi:MAG: sulfite exporter TauE/SafE family protein [Prosthecobacter sp.]|uniref:sulfite exporter TauE/SafE family protein n=1 Tax=Prosthecobacter sp. TaxID=1965333 RepID=UPI002638153C|nr:sulfite exporter TauE/SafE family protein [Prosthecobacter sp.]MCF7789621.1 sulfite exporter TauE/SafE family protein [Prosthecobacter sp.]